MTTRIGVHGAAGRMGGHVIEAVLRSEGASLAAAIERPGHRAVGREVAPGIEISSDLKAGVADSGVVIDFSLPDGTLALVAAATAQLTPLVIATTGFSGEQIETIHAAASQIPIVMAPNFSLGVNVLIDLVAQAAARLPDYEIEVLELHHSAKVDAPSGTALILGRSAAEARGRELDDLAVYHREGHTGARTAPEIGMQTLRAGSSPGEHTVFIAGPGERLELTHRAQSREGFATGAVRAALWLAGKPAALYSMKDVLAG